MFKKATMTKAKRMTKDNATVNFKSAAQEPWKMVSYIVVSLEQLGDGNDSLPGSCESPFPA